MVSLRKKKSLLATNKMFTYPHSVNFPTVVSLLMEPFLYHHPQVSLSMDLLSNLSMGDGWHVKWPVKSPLVLQMLSKRSVGKQTPGCR